MGRLKKTTNLDVYLNNVKVSTLTKDMSGRISMKYDSEWIHNGFPISYSLPLQESSFKGDVVTRYLDNLLPDNIEIKKTVATKFGAESTRPFDMLAVIGRDCVGALSFLPEGFVPKNTFELKYNPLTKKEITQRLNGLSSATPLGMADNDFRLSIAGAQEKTAFLKINNKWCEPIGLTPTTHIFKKSLGALGMDADFSDSVDNEYFCLWLLRHFGLDSCNSEIEIFDDDKVLVVERFDRKWAKLNDKDILVRIPQEDLCQALEVSPYQKYQSEGGPGIVDICQLLRASINENDRANFFKAIMIFDLLYATDGHAKNFSLTLNSKGFKLTPFYDVMSGYFLHARENHALEKLKLAMKVGKTGHYAFKRISLKHYAQTAKACAINPESFDKIVSEIKNDLSILNINFKQLDKNLNQDTATMIIEGMNKRAKILLK
ncbi:MAG: serine/threonine protein kinase [Halobacteriovoraceae bacterium]|nr:serine/threonine protein kinase [Halobacteriovoraceae bacterium]|tara:strand:+ start:13418 stop:14716 length:1299 start_codon:yes stop_codon:yes gene_type:complete